MNHYLEALYLELQQNLLGRRLWSNSEYRRLSSQRESAQRALEAQLTPPQLAALEKFLDASAMASLEERQAFFQEAVALGKWMVGSPGDFRPPRHRGPRCCCR